MITALGLYLLVLLGITYWSSRRESSDDFLIASRELGWKEIGLSIFASLISSYNIVIGVTFAYLFGIYYVAIFLSLIVAFIFFYYFFKKNHHLFKREQFITVVDYFHYRFGSWVGKITALIFLAVLLFFIILQINVNTLVFTQILAIDKFTATALVATVVLFYVWIGGFKTVVKTDVFQGILMFVVVLLAFFTGTEHISTETLQANLTDSSLFYAAISLIIIQFLVLVTQPELWQRMYAAKSLEDLKFGFMFSFFLAMILLIPIAIIGMNAGFGGLLENPGNAFYDILSFAAPNWLLPILAVSLLAAFMSTLDSSLFALSTQLAKTKLFKAEEKQDIKKYTRLWIPIILLVTSVASLFFADFLTSVFQLISLLMITSTVLLLGLWMKLPNKEVGFALVVGVAAFIYSIYGGVVTQEPITSLYSSFFVFLFILVQRFVFFALRFLVRYTSNKAG